MISRDDITRNIESLPAFSQTSLKLSHILQKPDFSLSEFEETISYDPSLVANLLKLANSSYFGIPRKINNIKLAINLLGAKRVFEAAIANELGKILPPVLKGYQISSTDFWKHCAAVAIIATNIAKEKDHSAEMIFTAGLLHDLGKLVVSTYLEQNPSQMTQLIETNLTETEVEQKMLGIDHCEVGELICKKWKLTSDISEVNRYHHNPEDTVDESSRNIVAMVHIADSLSHTMGMGSDVAELMRSVSPWALARFNMKTHDLERLASESLDDILELSEIFNEIRSK
ncbi:MAG: HDOD domain-containing protein [Deltaproteobacteria bacterium]|nr:HDOD domain-containing protein [Deltaproteobacteria bacterium]